MDEQKWIRTRGFCGTQGAEDVPTYGVRVEYPGGVWMWTDVDTDPEVVQRLVERLNAVQPEPCHFTDVVLDFIEEWATTDL